jgi:hypothetical protein
MEMARQGGAGALPGLCGPCDAGYTVGGIGTASAVGNPPCIPVAAAAQECGDPAAKNYQPAAAPASIAGCVYAMADPVGTEGPPTAATPEAPERPFKLGDYVGPAMAVALLASLAIALCTFAWCYRRHSRRLKAHDAQVRAAAAEGGQGPGGDEVGVGVGGVGVGGVGGSAEAAAERGERPGDSPSPPPPPPAAGQAQVGERVAISGLLSRSELNGTFGLVTAVEPSGRFVVRLEGSRKRGGEVLSLKGGNITAVEEEDGEGGAEGRHKAANTPPPGASAQRAMPRHRAATRAEFVRRMQAKAAQARATVQGGRGHAGGAGLPKQRPRGVAPPASAVPRGVRTPVPTAPPAAASLNASMGSPLGGALPLGWEEFKDEATGEAYYFHAVRGQTTWERPET